MNYLHTLADIYRLCVNNKWDGEIKDPKSTINNLNIAYILTETSSKLTAADISFGNIVILKLTNSVVSVAALLSLWYKGCTIVPLKASLSAIFLQNVIHSSKANYVIEVTDELIITKLEPTANSRFKYLNPRRSSGSDLALIIYTSGSTKTPKGIMLTHNNVIAALNSISDYLNITPQERILCLSPLSFDYGLYQALLAFKNDCTTFLFDQMVEPIAMANLIKQEQITTLPLVPVTAIMCAKTLNTFKEHYLSLSKITNTGGQIPNEIIQKIVSCLPQINFFAMYGLTEAKRVFYLPPKDLKTKLGSVGVPIPGLEAKIFCEDSTAIPPAKLDTLCFSEAKPFEVGTLYVRGPTVMQGYTDSELNRTNFISGNYRDDLWLNTGDLFLTDQDGYFYFKGRAKELIKQAAHCIYPLEIENIVYECEIVHLCAVIADIDNDNNEIAHLFVELMDDTPDMRNQVRSWLSQRIDYEYLPKALTFTTALPLNSNGKLDKKQLRTKNIP